MKLILQAVKAFLRKVENAIKQVSSEVLTLSNQLSKVKRQATQTQSKVERVENDVEQLYNSVNNIPRHIAVSGFEYGLRPYNKTQLEVGGQTYVENLPSFYSDYADTLPIGSSVDTNLHYVMDNGNTAVDSVVLHKYSTFTLEGGAWVSLGLSKPQYYFIVIQQNGSSFYYRYI